MRTQLFNPYGFDVNWYGSAMRMADVTKNPLLACAYIALLSSIFGEREFWLHVGFLAQAVAVVLGTYTLAHRFCQRPFLCGAGNGFNSRFSRFKHDAHVRRVDACALALGDSWWLLAL